MSLDISFFSPKVKESGWSSDFRSPPIDSGSQTVDPAFPVPESWIPGSKLKGSTKMDSGFHVDSGSHSMDSGLHIY